MQERHHVSIGGSRLAIAGAVRFEQADGRARAVRTRDREGSANGKVRPLAASNSSEAVTTRDRTAVEASAPDRRDASIFAERNPMHLHVISSRPGDEKPERMPAPSRARRYSVVIARLVSALALLAVGAIHIQQYDGGGLQSHPHDRDAVPAQLHRRHGPWALSAGPGAR